VLLVLLTVAVAHRRWPVSLDDAVERGLPSPGGRGVPDLFGDLAQAVATVATPSVTAAVTVLIALVWSMRTKTVTPLRRAVPPVVAMSAVVLIGKASLHRVGPPGSDLPHLLGYFPSGHTATALVCVGTVAALVADVRPRWHRRLSWLVAAWTLLVAGSMVFHRYHWLTDVVASMLLGVLILRLNARFWSAGRAADAPGRTRGWRRS
jgi:membrane-associated phospholipid phosphatase